MISSDSYWTKLCTYTTVKKAQIIDPKIALSHKAVMIAITAWILTGVFRDFNYVLSETPGTSVNAYIDQAGFTTSRLNSRPHPRGTATIPRQITTTARRGDTRTTTACSASRSRTS